MYQKFFRSIIKFSFINKDEIESYIKKTKYKQGYQENLMDIEMFRDFKKSNVNQDYGVP